MHPKLSCILLGLFDLCSAMQVDQSFANLYYKMFHRMDKSRYAFQMRFDNQPQKSIELFDSYGSFEIKLIPGSNPEFKVIKFNLAATSEILGRFGPFFVDLLAANFCASNALPWGDMKILKICYRIIIKFVKPIMIERSTGLWVSTPYVFVVYSAYRNCDETCSSQVVYSNPVHIVDVRKDQEKQLYEALEMISKTKILASARAWATLTITPIIYNCNQETLITGRLATQAFNFCIQLPPVKMTETYDDIILSGFYPMGTQIFYFTNHTIYDSPNFFKISRLEGVSCESNGWTLPRDLSNQQDLHKKCRNRGWFN